MAHIQVDMFEVQLGAALLLQVKTKTGRIVRVLADAGVTAGGYPHDHVHKKLGEAFEAFGEKRRYLDLIVGTHYDADHLEGLVPIIDDESIDIGEAWMPPVANDTEPHAADARVEERHLLGRQFAAENGERVLDAYWRAKADVCEHLRALEWMGDGRTNRLVDRARFDEVERAREKPDLRFFQQHVADANATLSERTHTHADEDVPDDPVFVSDLQFILRGLSSRDGVSAHTSFADSWKNNRPLAAAQMRSMAYIRRSSATDAINAASLAKVVNSLKARSIPTSYNMVKVPEIFFCRSTSQRNVFDLPGFRLSSRTERLSSRHGFPGSSLHRLACLPSAVVLVGA